MRTSVKVFFVMLLFSALFIPLGQFPAVYSETSTLPDKALAYTMSVLPLDIKQYNITLDSYYTLPSGPSDTSRTEAVAYILNSNGSKLRVVFVFKNGDLYQIGLSVEAGSVINARSYANLADVARDILEKYQAFTGTGSTEMIRTLSMVDETKYVTVTSGNVNLTVSHMAIPKTISTSSGHIEAVGTDTINVTSFNWVYVFNGAEYNHVYVSFENGVFHTFWDDRAINKIGDTDVNITKEQAIDIAMKYIENYSYASGGVQVSGFNVTKDRTVANLLTTVRDGDMLYPFWSVFLYLNQTYPSGVNSLLVKVWADSGEVFECSKETGGSQTVNDSNPESTPTPQPQDSASPTATPSLPSDNPNSESPSPSPEVQSSGNPDSASTPTPETNAPSPAVDNPALSAGTQSPDMLLIGIGIATAIAVATAATVIVVFVKRRRK